MKRRGAWRSLQAALTATPPSLPAMGLGPVHRGGDGQPPRLRKRGNQECPGVPPRGCAGSWCPFREAVRSPVSDARSGPSRTCRHFACGTAALWKWFGPCAPGRECCRRASSDGGRKDLGQWRPGGAQGPSLLFATRRRPRCETPTSTSASLPLNHDQLWLCRGGWLTAPMSGGNLQPAPRDRTPLGGEWVYRGNCISQ